MGVGALVLVHGDVMLQRLVWLMAIIACSG
jgi:hypothetical protein